MIIVFRSRLRRGVEERYERRVEEVAAIGESMPGFVSSKDFTAEDGERLTLIEFESAETLAAWRAQAEHRRAQAEGRDEFFECYSVQVCELVRESSFVAKGESSGEPG